MEFYVYAADVWCTECAEKIKAESTNKPLQPEDETSYDSDMYPKGPYSEEETDVPEHCAGCKVFLENPLTQAGYDYLREKVAEYVDNGHGMPDVINEWREFYPEAWE